MELDPQTTGLGCRMVDPVVTDGAQSLWQDVTQITPDKLHSRHGQTFRSTCVPVFPSEGDGAVGDMEDALITDGRARHVGPKIFNGRGAVAGRLNMNTPVLAPDGWIHLPAVFRQQLAQLLAKGG